MKLLWLSVLQVTNAGVRRPGNKTRISSSIMQVAIILATSQCTDIGSHPGLAC